MITYITPFQYKRIEKQLDLMGFLFAKHASPQNTTVLDLDSRVINYISSMVSKLQLNINTLEYNVLNNLPLNLRGLFDFFYTNPPFGSKNKGNSCKAFVMRGIEACKLGGYGAFVLPSEKQNEWAIEVTRSVLNFIISSGCKLVEKVADFQSYEGNPILSSLFIIQKKYIVDLDTKFIGGICLY